MPGLPGTTNDVGDFARLERRAQYVVPALIQNLAPEALVCESRRNDESRRVRQRLALLEEKFPVPIRQFALADDDWKRLANQQGQRVLSGRDTVQGPAQATENC